MTAVLALEDGNLGRSVTIPKSAADVPADSSLVPVSPGEVMTMKDLLYGMMIRSGNDAANAVATLTSGSVQDFVARMNARASELGMSGTHFTNPHGYHDADHYTTARDMLRLTRYALQSKTFRKILTTRSYTIGKTVNVTDKVTKLTSTKNVDSVISNTYDLLKPAYANYYPYALGGKTGYTYPAGQCFAGVARRDGRTVVIALFHSGLDKDDRWTDAVRLFEYGFAAIEAREKAA